MKMGNQIASKSNPTQKYIKKNGIRSRGKISIEKILTDSLLAIHRVNAYTDEYRNLPYKKAYVCLLHPDGLGIQHNWQPDKGIFDSEIMTDSFWEAPAAIQKMVQKDIPMEVICVNISMM